jgi:MscS family membrane protein
MVSVFGFTIQLPPEWGFINNIYGSFILTFVVWLLVALALYIIATYPFRWMLRRQPGEVADIILEIIRKPIILLTLAFGILNSLELLPLTAEAIDLLERIFKTIVIILIVHISWWFVKDVLVYYGNRWARQTESSLDDVLFPALNLFSPLIILVAGSLGIFPIWGIDVSSVLVGAGVVGLVLGLALQEPLSNVFSGLALLIEAPFRPGDLIVFSGDKIGEVERLGLRSTQIYSVDDHATVFVPNRALSANILTNLNKPTVEQKYSITVTLSHSTDLARAQEELKQIAHTHPNVVAENLGDKIALLRERIALNQQRIQTTAPNDLARRGLVEQMDKYTQAAHKLELEDEWNRQILAFQDALLDLLPAIRSREYAGLSSKELRELHEQYVVRANQAFEQIIRLADAWSQSADPWTTDREKRQQRKLWLERNQRFKTKWENLQTDLANPRARIELRLDDLTVGVLDWLKKEYKVLPEDWKNPAVTFKEFNEFGTVVQLWFFVDNVRLEHFSRPHRVQTEIARQIREQFGNQFAKGAD